MSQELRQGINKLEIVGVVKESRLNAGSGENGNYINGSLIIKAGEFTELELRVFVNEKTSTGNVRRVYTTLESILNKEHETLADGASEEDAVKVRVWGTDNFTPQFREEMYVSDNNPNVTTTRISLDLGFGNVNINNTLKEEDYRAEFDVEMYVQEVVEEVKNSEETGRAIVRGFVPAYGGSVFPIEVIAGKVKDEEEGDFDFGAEVLDNVQEGDTVRLWGEIDYKTIITKREIGGSLGRAKTEETREYINELNAVGGDIIDDPDKMFDEDLIRIAMKERENKKIEVLEESKNKKKSGSGRKGRGNVGRERRRPRTHRNENVDAKPIDISDDDLPF